MGQAPVAQRISVVDAEAEAEYIEVGQDRAEGTDDQKRFGTPGR
jgi:hypothetical protein